jgi:hypothetical protein
MRLAAALAFGLILNGCSFKPADVGQSPRAVALGNACASAPVLALAPEPDYSPPIQFGSLSLPPITDQPGGSWTPDDPVASLAVAGGRRPVFQIKEESAPEAYDSSHRTTVYFSDQQIGGGDTLADFLRDGGILVSHEPGSEDMAERAVAAVGDRAQIVKLGRVSAALVHADPVGGVRSFNLYFSFGGSSWTIIGNAEPQALLDMAAQIVCQ